MTLRQLECFVAVARERHFRRAADRLERTQPAVSLQIHRLEGELGLTLFDRSGARISLTGTGELFLPHAERILAESKLALLHIEEIRAGVRGRIRIGLLPSLASHFIPAVLQEFGSRFPDVRIILQESELSQDLIPLLVNGHIDFALAEDGAKLSSLRSLPLFEERFCVGVAQTHPFASRSEISASALRHERFITYKIARHHTREVMLKVCSGAGFEAEIAFECEEVETIQYLVAANLGITILPEMVLRESSSKGISMLRLKDDIPRRTIVLYRKVGNYSSRAFTHFINTVKEFSPPSHTTRSKLDARLPELRIAG